MNPNKKKILIVDDHPIVRDGLRLVINQTTTDMEVCGEAEDPATAMTMIENLKPDVAVVDLTLKGGSGIDLIKNAHAYHPELPVLVISMHSESQYAERALRAGAKGYLMKHEVSGQLVQAIRGVLAGQLQVSERMMPHLLKNLFDEHAGPAEPLESLSDREMEVFRMIGQGLKAGEIAKRMSLSVRTIDTYREHIKKKLGLKSSVELYQQAFAALQGELEPGHAKPEER